MSLSHQIIATGEGRAPALLHYDAACRALAEAKSVDDVKDIRDKSEAIRAYAKQAKNKQLEVDAAEIRIKAERRLGEMIAAQRDAGLLSKGAAGEGAAKRGSQENPRSLPTLAEAGIDKNLADRARKLAAIPESEFDEIVSDWRERVERENERVSINLLRSGERHSAAQAADTRTEGERDADAIQSAWDRAADEGRALFIARNKLTESNQATGKGGGDVDCSAERASSAVKVGARVSPERATMSEAGPSSASHRPSLAARGADQSAAFIPETPANPSAPQARQADRAGEANPPASPAPQSKADMIRRLRPHCQHPGTDLCGGAGRNHCHSCKKLMAESEAA